MAGACLAIAVGVGVAAAMGRPVWGVASASPQPPTAPSLFVAPAGNDAAPCTQASPCASWNRAYQRARPGQVIEVAGGTYPGQVISSRGATRNLSPGCAPGSTASCIVFRPAAGQIVTINGSLEVHGSSVWVQGNASPAGGIPSRSRAFTISVAGYVDTEADSGSVYPDHVVFEGIHATSFGVFNVDTATFRNMDIGPATVGAGCGIVEGPGIENKIGFGGGITVVPRNITLSGMLIHNQNRNADGAASNCHFGGLFLVTADGLTIRSSVFSQNAVYNIQVQNFGGAPPPTNVTIENNWFGCPVGWLYEPNGPNQCDGQVDVQFNAPSQFSNWLIRYNDFGAGLGQYVGGASYANVRVLGNAGSSPSQCFAGWSFAYNAWDRRGCSPTDRNVRSLPFVSAVPGSEDFHLAPGSAARALVPPTSPDLQLASDMEGRMRPLHFPNDAGALQRDTALMLLGRTIGSAAIGAKRDDVLRLYGQPRRSRPAKLGPAKATALVDTFSVPGGTLQVTSVNDLVVGLATASPYYTTFAGLGAGSPLADAGRLSSVTWVKCKNAFQLLGGPVTVSFAAGQGKRKVADVIMTRSAYVQPCPAAAGKKPAAGKKKTR